MHLSTVSVHENFTIFPFVHDHKQRRGVVFSSVDDPKNSCYVPLSTFCPTYAGGAAYLWSVPFDAECIPRGKGCLLPDVYWCKLNCFVQGVGGGCSTISGRGRRGYSLEDLHI